MAKHRVVTKNTEIDRAIERAKDLEDEIRVTEVRYVPGGHLDLLILTLSDGRRVMIPREDVEGLQTATRAQIGAVEIIGRGTGLHWPDLDLDHYVPSLLRGIYGTKRWMAQIGRSGGSATSKAKTRASRANGLKGGRPRKVAAVS